MPNPKLKSFSFEDALERLPKLIDAFSEKYTEWVVIVPQEDFDITESKYWSVFDAYAQAFFEARYYILRVEKTEPKK